MKYFSINHHNQNNMSFLDKLVENKGKILIALGATTLVAFGFLVKGYKDAQRESEQGQNDSMSEIQKLKRKLNNQGASLEIIQQILVYAMKESKGYFVQATNKFKEDRAKYTKQSRRANMKGYLQFLVEGLMGIQNSMATSYTQITEKIGLTQQQLIPYQHQLAPLMEKLSLQTMKPTEVKPMSLQEVKKYINMQTDYLKAQGQDMIDRMIEATRSWAPQSKTILPTILNIVISDQAFEGQTVDETSLQFSQAQFSGQLRAQLIELQRVIQPLVMKILQASGMGGGMGMGGMGMGGMGGMGGMQGMGGMGGQMPSMEQMMMAEEQLRQMQAQDPQGFQQMMAMMRNQYR